MSRVVGQGECIRHCAVDTIWMGCCPLQVALLENPPSLGSWRGIAGSVMTSLAVAGGGVGSEYPLWKQWNLPDQKLKLCDGFKRWARQSKINFQHQGPKQQKLLSFASARALTGEESWLVKPREAQLFFPPGRDFGSLPHTAQTLLMRTQG